MYISRAVYRISHIPWGKLKLASSVIYVSSRISPQVNAWSCWKKEEVLWWRFWMQNFTIKRKIETCLLSDFIISSWKHWQIFFESDKKMLWMESYKKNHSLIGTDAWMDIEGTPLTDQITTHRTSEIIILFMIFYLLSYSLIII